MATTTVTLTTRTATFSSVLRPHTAHMEREYWNGMNDAIRRRPCRQDVTAAIVTARAGRGFKARVGDLLTPPDAQHKLDMASVKSYGMTLAHADMSGYEMCPWRGPGCTFTCVIGNGNGRYDSVQRAWLWRTDLWTTAPLLAAYRMGWELGKAVRKYGDILFRPDVNSDAAWHLLVPALGRTPGVTTYGYTKNPAVLTARFHDHGFKYAYSWNESSKIARVQEHLARGGKVAVVTSRKRAGALDVDAIRAFFGVTDTVAVLDADVTDEWILSDGPAIGDLTAKGKARSLIGHSAFVVDCY